MIGWHYAQLSYFETSSRWMLSNLERHIDKGYAPPTPMKLLVHSFCADVNGRGRLELCSHPSVHPYSTWFTTWWLSCLVPKCFPYTWSCKIWERNLSNGFAAVVADIFKSRLHGYMPYLIQCQSKVSVSELWLVLYTCGSGTDRLNSKIKRCGAVPLSMWCIWKNVSHFARFLGWTTWQDEEWDHLPNALLEWGCTY